jgi:hypothetical protein
MVAAQHRLPLHLSAQAKIFSVRTKHPAIMSCANRDQQLTLKRKLKYRPAIGPAIQLVPCLRTRRVVAQSVVAVGQCVEPMPGFPVFISGSNAFDRLTRPTYHRLISRPPSLVQQTNRGPTLVDGERAHHEQSPSRVQSPNSAEFAAQKSVREAKTRPVHGDVEPSLAVARSSGGFKSCPANRVWRRRITLEQPKSAFALGTVSEHLSDCAGGSLCRACRHSDQPIYSPLITKPRMAECPTGPVFVSLAITHPRLNASKSAKFPLRSDQCSVHQ